MAVVTSIRHDRITNDYNDGANSLKNFLKYAEAVSRGDEPAARRVLENLNSLTRKTPSLEARPDAVCEAVAAGLRARGYEVDLRVGQSRFRCDLAVRAPTENMYQLGVLVDTETHYANPSALDRYLTQPSILRAFGWRFALVLTKDWFHDPDDVLNRLERLLKGIPTTHEELELEDAAALTAASPNREPEGTGEAVAAAQHPSSGQSAPGDPDPPTTDAMPAPSPGGGQTRRFEFIEGNSSKFWEVTLSDTSFTVRFGRIGALGQSQSKSFADPTQARREAEKLIAEKMKKGYVERVKNRQSS
jgi:predicted DNA-binding WGR domain protein